MNIQGGYPFQRKEHVMQRKILFMTPLIFALGALLVTGTAQAQNISQSAMAGSYAVTLKVLPAESFTGPGAEMAWDGGARANTLNGRVKPNHHLVVFVKKNDKPVEQGEVLIRYRMLTPQKGQWALLPVARMHEAGKGLETTHYGNNVRLAAGHYEVQVRVNKSAPAVFRFSL
jgi:hypothetical protein